MFYRTSVALVGVDLRSMHQTTCVLPYFCRSSLASCLADDDRQIDRANTHLDPQSAVVVQRMDHSLTVVVEGKVDSRGGKGEWLDRLKGEGAEHMRADTLGQPAEEFRAGRSLFRSESDIPRATNSGRPDSGLA